MDKLLGSDPVNRVTLVVIMALLGSLLGVETMEVPGEEPDAPIAIADAGVSDDLRVLCEEALRATACECTHPQAEDVGGEP